MWKKILVVALGLGVGMYVGFLIVNNTWNKKADEAFVVDPIAASKNQVVAFLPYWLIDSATRDYSKYINTLSYFGVVVAGDGSIEKYTKPGESEPGYFALKNGKADGFLDMAKKNNMKKSLLVFSADEEKIYELISDPVTHAKTMVAEVAPLMREYGFTDLNIDVESVTMASDSARANFTIFVKTVRQEVNREKLGTITIDVSPIVLFKNYLVDLTAIKNDVDYVVLMTYDYHYQNSSVTGAVAPVGGAGDTQEFDVEVSVKAAVQILFPQKIILGVPLYGYEWETISDLPRSATIPGSGIVAANRRVEEKLKSCTNCTSFYDEITKESILIFKDEKNDSYHQIYYPNQNSMGEKIKLANKYNLGGIALWALGYDGENILDPLKIYK